MKNKILLSAMVAVSTMVFSASANAENTGCGLGTVLFQGNKGQVSEILAVTTNGTSGNQTFGISSGTSGCQRGSTIGAGKRIRLFAFAEKNMDEIALDVSRGNGEYLASVADIIGIKESDKAHFFNVSQKNFSTIFSSENTNTAGVVDNISAMLSNDAVLKTYKL